MDSIPETLHRVPSLDDEPLVAATSSWIVGAAFSCVIVGITMMLRNVGGTRFEPTTLEQVLQSHTEDEEETEVTDPLVDELLTQRENEAFERVETSNDRAAYWEDLKRRLASVDSRLEDVPEIVFEIREAQESFQHEGRAFIDRLDGETTLSSIEKPDSEVSHDMFPTAITNRIENLLITNERLRAEHRQLESRYIFERNSIELEFEREFGNAAHENELLRTRLAELEVNDAGQDGDHDVALEVKNFTNIMKDIGGQQKDMMQIVSDIGQEVAALDRIGKGDDMERLRAEVDKLMDENSNYKNRVEELEHFIAHGTGLSQQTADQLASEVLDATEDLMAADQLSSSVALSGLDKEDTEPPALTNIYQQTLHQKNRLEKKNKELEAELEESKKRRDQLEPSVTAVQILTQQVSSLSKELDGKEEGHGLEDGKRASPWSDSTEVNNLDAYDGTTQPPSIPVLQRRITTLESALEEARAQRDDCSREMLRQKAAKNEARDQLSAVQKELVTASEQIGKVGEIVAWRLIQTVAGARGWGSSTALNTSMKSMDWANVLVKKFVADLSETCNHDRMAESVDKFVTEIELRRGAEFVEDDQENSNADGVRSDEAVNGVSVRRSLSEVFNGEEDRGQQLGAEVDELSDVVGGDTLVDVVDAPVEEVLLPVGTEEERARELLGEVGSEAGVGMKEVEDVGWGAVRGASPVGKAGFDMFAIAMGKDVDAAIVGSDDPLVSAVHAAAHAAE